MSLKPDNRFRCGSLSSAAGRRLAEPWLCRPPAGDGRQRPTPNPGGFMLLEVLIAFVIATLALGVMIGAETGALQASLTAAHYDEATVRAQSRLAEAVNGGAPIPGEREGSDGGGYRWRVRVTSAAGVLPHPAADGEASEILYAVTVWITWRDGGRARDVRLDTEHIGQAVRAP